MNGSWKKTTALLLLGALLASCGESAAANTESGTEPSAPTGENTEAAVNTEEAETEALYSSALAPEDLGGREIRILTYANSDYQNSYMDVWAETFDGTTLNDAVMTRNGLLAEKYNITFAFFDGKDNGSAQSLLQKSVKAGEDAYDLAFLNADGAVKLGISGYLNEIGTLPNLSLSMPWWNQPMLSSSAILGKNYFLIGDMNVDTWTQSYAVFFNKALAEQHDVTDLYETVLDGKWTLDKLDAITRTLYQDLNGNGAYDENDLYGLAACSVCIDCFWASADVNFVRADDTGLTLQFTDAYYSLWDKMVSLLAAPEMLYTDRPQYTSMRDTYDRGAFLEDRALFFIEGLCVADRRLREMKSNFGILPLPKMDETQKTYRTFSHASHNSTVSFPTTVQDIGTATKIAEDMAFFSISTVRPAYYDKLLTGKIARDENSIAMLDILTQNIQYDLAFLLLNNSLTWPMRTEITKGNPAASWAEKSLKKCQKELDKYVTQITESQG